MNSLSTDPYSDFHFQPNFITTKHEMHETDSNIDQMLFTQTMNVDQKLRTSTVKMSLEEFKDQLKLAMR